MEIKFETKEFFSYSIELQRKLAREVKNRDLISGILKSKDRKVLLSLSSNPFLQEEHLEILSKMDYNLIKINVAKHKNSGENTLYELSKSHSKVVVENVARNPSTSNRTFRDIIARASFRSETDNVLMCIICRNPSADEETIKQAKELISIYNGQWEYYHRRTKF